MPQFINIFGDEHKPNGERKFSDGILSMLTSLVQVGELVGALASSFIGGWSGRRGMLLSQFSKYQEVAMLMF